MVYCAGKLIENLTLLGYHAGKPIESVVYCLNSQTVTRKRLD